MLKIMSEKKRKKMSKNETKSRCVNQGSYSWTEKWTERKTCQDTLPQCLAFLCLKNNEWNREKMSKKTTKKQHGHHEYREWNLSKGDQGGMRADLELYTPSIFYVLIVFKNKVDSWAEEIERTKKAVEYELLWKKEEVCFRWNLVHWMYCVLRLKKEGEYELLWKKEKVCFRSNLVHWMYCVLRLKQEEEYELLWKNVWGRALYIQCTVYLDSGRKGNMNFCERREKNVSGRTLYIQYTVDLDSTWMIKHLPGLHLPVNKQTKNRHKIMKKKSVTQIHFHGGHCDMFNFRTIP